jgi:hypothetical protein
VLTFPLGRSTLVLSVLLRNRLHLVFNVRLEKHAPKRVEACHAGLLLFGGFCGAGSASTCRGLLAVTRSLLGGEVGGRFVQ